MVAKGRGRKEDRRGRRTWFMWLDHHNVWDRLAPADDDNDNMALGIITANTEKRR